MFTCLEPHPGPSTLAPGGGGGTPRKIGWGCASQNLKGKKMITDRPRFQYFRSQFGRSCTRMFTGFTTGDKKEHYVDVAKTPSSPTRPVNDRDRVLLFTTYILSTMTSLTAKDSTSATKRRIGPFHALKNSSSGKRQFHGMPFALPSFVFT